MQEQKYIKSNVLGYKDLKKDDWKGSFDCAKQRVYFQAKSKVDLILMFAFR